MNKFHLFPHYLLWIWDKTLKRTSLTITLNVRTVNVILLMLNTWARVFLTKMSEISCDEFSVRTKQTNKKTCREKEGRKILQQQQLIIITNFPQIYLWIHDKYTPPASKKVSIGCWLLRLSVNFGSFTAIGCCCFFSVTVTKKVNY